MEVYTYNSDEFNHTVNTTEGVYTLNERRNGKNVDARHEERKRRILRAVVICVICAAILAVCLIAGGATAGVLTTGEF